jgi:hypothetical protein
MLSSPRFRHSRRFEVQVALEIQCNITSMSSTIASGQEQKSTAPRASWMREIPNQIILRDRESALPHSTPWQRPRQPFQTTERHDDSIAENEHGPTVW